MHEASLVQGLIDLAARALESHNSSGHARKARKIRGIKCSYGLLACFEPETLQACFEIFSENTLCEGANLLLELEPLDCRCGTCGRQFFLDSRKFECPFCSGTEINFTGGNGLVLQALEVEEENADD